MDHEELHAFAQSVVEAFGTPTDVAESVATSLVGADLRGHGSHGVRRLAEFYPEMIARDQLRPAVRPTRTVETALFAGVDAGRGWGHHAGREAVELGIERAADRGLGLATVRNGAHLGRIGAFAERAADRGYVCVCFTNTGGEAPMMAPPGSAERRLAANPYTVGVPAFGELPHPVVLDTSMTNVSHGKILERKLAGEDVPEGWAVGEDGAPLTDAEAFEAGVGAILPVGGQQFGYKGAAMSAVAELLVGVLADGTVLGAGDDEAGLVNNGSVFLVVDPARLSDAEDDAARVAAYRDYLDATAFSDAVPAGEAWDDRLWLPGRVEYDRRRGREAAGIPLDDRTVASLVDVASEYDVAERPAAFPAE